MITPSSITVGESFLNIKPVDRNLGSWFDSQISMLCSSAFFHLHNISRIRKFLSPVETKSLVHAFVTSRVDYCNSLLYGLPASQLNKVQRVYLSTRHDWPLKKAIVNLPISLKGYSKRISRNSLSPMRRHKGLAL